LTKGLANSRSVEYVEFSCCNLNDTHGKFIKRLIKEQFELKEALKWNMSLRRSKDVNIAAIGLKSINLSRNRFSDDFVEIIGR
jgi:hypothetical protein